MRVPAVTIPALTPHTAVPHPPTPGPRLRAQLNNGSYVHSVSLEFPAVPDGAGYALAVRATDVAGNMATGYSSTLTVDSRPPVVTYVRDTLSNRADAPGVGEDT
jgi:hypothetical protein